MVSGFAEGGVGLAPGVGVERVAGAGVDDAPDAGVFEVVDQVRPGVLGGAGSRADVELGSS